MAPKTRNYQNRVREAREQAGIHKQIDLAKLAGISVATLSRIEHNQHGLSLTTAQALAAAMGCKIEDLIMKGGEREEGSALEDPGISRESAKPLCRKEQ